MCIFFKNTFLLSYWCCFTTLQFKLEGYMIHIADIEHQLLMLKRYYCICLIARRYDWPYKLPGRPGLQRRWQPAHCVWGIETVRKGQIQNTSVMFQNLSWKSMKSPVPALLCPFKRWQKSPILVKPKLLLKIRKSLESREMNTLRLLC